jgi:hypothetical protein
MESESASTRAIGRSSAEWYGASPSSTSDRANATPTLPSRTFMALEMLSMTLVMLR